MLNCLFELICAVAFVPLFAGDLPLRRSGEIGHAVVSTERLSGGCGEDNRISHLTSGLDICEGNVPPGACCLSVGIDVRT